MLPMEPISAIHGFLNLILMMLSDLSVTCHVDYKGTANISVWTESWTILYVDDWNALPTAKYKKAFPTCLKYLLKLVWSHLKTYTVEEDSNLGIVSESFVQNWPQSQDAMFHHLFSGSHRMPKHQSYPATCLTLFLKSPLEKFKNALQGQSYHIHISHSRLDCWWSIEQECWAIFSETGCNVFLYQATSGLSM